MTIFPNATHRSAFPIIELAARRGDLRRVAQTTAPGASRSAKYSSATNMHAGHAHADINTTARRYTAVTGYTAAAMLQPDFRQRKLLYNIQLGRRY